MHPSSHGTHRGDSPIPAILSSGSQVLRSPKPRQFCSSNQVCSRVVVAQTLCPSRNPKRSSHKGLSRVTVQATDVTCTVKDKVFVPPQPVSIPDLKNRITAAVETIIPDLLSRVWQVLDYRLDVCRVTKGAYFEHL